MTTDERRTCSRQQQQTHSRLRHRHRPWPHLVPAILQSDYKVPRVEHTVAVPIAFGPGGVLLRFVLAYSQNVD